ncbi:hypothetical protein V1478_006251 [Vespula squamosa]|uniref:Uncharacterized protein n=1 Tax=Vespula squamosa TaxID=30214 RepID=A0ABD2B7B0_VESSQ
MLAKIKKSKNLSKCHDVGVVIRSITPKDEIKTLRTVTRNIPITVQLLAVSALHICASTFTSYLLFQINPIPTTT